MPEQKDNKDERSRDGVQLSLVCEIHRVQREQHGEQIHKQVLTLVARRGYYDGSMIVPTPSDSPAPKQHQIWDDREENTYGDPIAIPNRRRAPYRPQKKQRGEATDHHKQSGDR